MHTWTHILPLETRAETRGYPPTPGRESAGRRALWALSWAPRGCSSEGQMAAQRGCPRDPFQQHHSPWNKVGTLSALDCKTCGEGFPCARNHANGKYPVAVRTVRTGQAWSIFLKNKNKEPKHSLSLPLPLQLRLGKVLIRKHWSLWENGRQRDSFLFAGVLLYPSPCDACATLKSGLVLSRGYASLQMPACLCSVGGSKVDSESRPAKSPWGRKGRRELLLGWR